MIYPLLYIDYLSHFHGDRDYFECHEVLEEHWKASGMERESAWVGLIQIAVCFYHYRRGNTRGALKMIEKAIHILKSKRTKVHSLGMDHEKLMQTLYDSCCLIRSNRPYQPINLPIQDTELLIVCKERTRLNGYKWGGPDTALNPYTNKHREKNVARMGNHQYFNSLSSLNQP